MTHMYPPIRRKDIYTTARSMLDTPYHHAGRHPTEGLDCSGLLACVATRLKYPYEDFTAYSRHVPFNLVPNHLRKWMDEAPLLPIPGNVACAWLDRHTKNPQHIVIFTPRGIIHCGEFGEAKVMEHPLDRMWRKRLVCAFTFRGVV